MVAALLPVYKRVEVDFTHALGVYIFDKDGNQYLDFASGYAAMSMGHCHPKLIEALTAQAQKMWHISNKFKIPGLSDYCKRLCDMSFADSAFVANTGAEAVECMIKMARRYYNDQGKTNKYRIITFDGAFHGRTFGAMSAGAPKMMKGFEPALDGFDRVAWNDIEAVKNAITANTAGIMIEPIQGEAGMRPCTEDFMRQLRKLCDEHDMLLMLDEVQCGMGRTGYMFAYEMYNVRPDLVALGKGIGGGFPVSACLATEAVAKAMYVGSHGSTFGGNPLAVAVGNAVLDFMLEPGFLDNVKKISIYLRSRLEEVAEKHRGVVESVTGKGLMQGIKLREQYDVELINNLCIKNYLISTPASNNVLRFTPPLIITQSHVDEAIEKLEKTLLGASKPGAMLVEKFKEQVNSIKKKVGL